MTFEEFFNLAESVKPEGVKLTESPLKGSHYAVWQVADGTQDIMEITALRSCEIMVGQPCAKEGSALGRWLFELDVIQWLGLIAGFLNEVE